MKNNPHYIVCVFGLILLLMLQVMFAKSQPQNNICDSSAYANASTIPATPTSLSFSGKTLTIETSDTPTGFLIKRFYAWSLGGQNGYAEFEYWGGLICSNTFYDYYLNTGREFQREVEAILRIYLPDITMNGNNKAYVRYEVMAINGEGFVSNSITTGYFKP